MPDIEIDGFRILDCDGKIIVKCYMGRDAVDVTIDVADLGLLVSDGARILRDAVARRCPQHRR